MGHNKHELQRNRPIGFNILMVCSFPGSWVVLVSFKLVEGNLSKTDLDTGELTTVLTSISKFILF